LWTGITRLIFRTSGNTPFSRDLLTIDVIDVASASMQPFQVDTFRGSYPNDVVFLRFLSELQLPWLRIKVNDDLAGYSSVWVIVSCWVQIMLFIRYRWESI
jgi:hypothetical protein